MSIINSTSMLSGASVPTETVVIPDADDWKDVNGSITFGTGTMDAGGGNGAGRSVDTFEGDFDLQFTVTSEANMSFGAYPISGDGTYGNHEGNGLIASIAGSYLYNGGDDALKYGSSATGTTMVVEDGTVVNLTRVGTAVSIFKNGSLVLEYATGSSAELRLMMGIGGAQNIDDIQWTI
jgi:hypothetical protein